VVRLACQSEASSDKQFFLSPRTLPLQPLRNKSVKEPVDWVLALHQKVKRLQISHHLRVAKDAETKSQRHSCLDGGSRPKMKWREWHRLKI
jgi:hypothetical protein